MSTEAQLSHNMEKHHPLRSVGGVLAKTAFVGACMGISINAFAETTIDSGPLAFDVETQIALPFEDGWYSGSTNLNVPPLGSVELDTHDAPFDINAQPASIDTRQLDAIGNNPQDELSSFQANLEDDVQAAKDDLLRKTGVAAGAGLMVGCGLLVEADRFRRNRTLTESIRSLGAPLALTGIISVALAGSTIYSSRHSQDALQHAEYTGLLATAPEVIGNIYDTGERFNAQTAELADIITYLGQLSDGYQDLLVIPNGVTNVLFVSDIHSQPGTFDLLERSVQQFNIDMIIDAGDLTDRGASFENAFFDQIRNLGVPYVFVRGNHDSEGTIAALREIPNVIILDGQTQEIAGLDIIGSADLRFTPDTSAPRDDEEDVRRQAQSLLTGIVRSQLQADIAVVHDPDAGPILYGSVPYVLSGHQHRFEQITENDTLHIISGTTGGAGLRAFENGEPTPRTATVLAFDDESDALVRATMLNFGAIGDNRSSVEVCDVVNNAIAC